MKRATHVTIKSERGVRTYRLGKVLQSGSRGVEVQCCADGCVYRVCAAPGYAINRGIETGCVLLTGGERLHFHRGEV